MILKWNFQHGSLKSLRAVSCRIEKGLPELMEERQVAAVAAIKFLKLTDAL